MSLSAKLRRAPQRLVTGAYIVNSGVGKLSADDDVVKQSHETAANTYPFLNRVQPKVFMKGLAIGEIALGSVILLPIVPTAVAGAALIGFSGATLNMYWNTPGMHEPGDPRPTPQGSGVAKDVWMLGIGASLLADSVLEPAHDKKIEIGAAVSEKRALKSAQKSGRSKRKDKKSAKKQAAEIAKQARELRDEASKRARKASEKARKETEKAAAKAAKRLGEVRAEYAPVAAARARQARDAARDWAEEYGPVAAEKARSARDAARDWAEEYGPVAAEKAAEGTKVAREWAGTASTVVADRTKEATKVAREKLAG